MSSTNYIGSPSVGFARPMGINPMVGVYDGKDLRPCATRPTRDIPTRVGDRLRYSDGRVTTLAGAPIEAPLPEPAAPTATPKPAIKATKAPIAALCKPKAAPKHAATAPPLRTVPTSSGYVPRPGSKPARAIAALRAMPQPSALLRSADTERLFDVTQRDWRNYFTAAINHGQLQILRIDGEWALALTSYRPAATAKVTP